MKKPEEVTTMGFIYTTVRGYRKQTPMCTGDFFGQDGEILAEDAEITICTTDNTWCAGHYDGSATWEPLE